jgi:hypothetical protein
MQGQASSPGSPTGATFAMRGVPLTVIKELMGHATIDMTERYAHLSPDTRREAVAVLTVLLLRRATYVQHGWRQLLTTRNISVKQWRRRESNPPPEASGENSRERSMAVFMGLPAVCAAPAPSRAVLRALQREPAVAM